MNKYILQHFGLGDFLSCKGLVKYLMQNDKDLTVNYHLYVPSRHFQSVTFLYSDENIKLIKVDNENSAIKHFSKNKLLEDVKDSELIKIGFQNFYKVIENEFRYEDYTTDMVFYKQFEVPYRYRFELGKWKRDHNEEERVFNKLNPKKEKFIFIHDDPKRNLLIQLEDINLTKDKIKIIRNDTSELIFNFGLLLERAEQIHVMESSIRNLIECLNINHKKLFLHSFRNKLSKGPFYSFNENKILGSSKNWNIIENNLNKDVNKDNFFSIMKKFYISKTSSGKVTTTNETFLKKIKYLIVFYIFKKQALIRAFSFLIEKLQIKKDIGIEIFKDDFHKELDKCLFFTTRSLIHSIGNFINQKEYPNKKKKFSNNEGSDVLFVKSSELVKFANNGLNKINKRFILFSGDSDFEVSIENKNDQSFNESVLKIVNDKNLLFWYTQNLNFNHPKISNLPHGLDYHTIFERRKGWANFKCSPTYQEKQLILTLNKSKLFDTRKEKIFNNWHFSLGHGNRKFIYDNMNKEDNFFLNKRLSRFLNWKEQSEYQYTFCPSGKGIDDPRVYESIILGSIPIRLEESILKFHGDLPIIYINKISDLNLNYINTSFKNFHNQKFNFEKLFLNHWKNKINLNTHVDLSMFQDISLEQFRYQLIQFYLKN